MKNEDDKFLDDLFLAARTTKPDTTAMERHFETRLLARIEDRQIGRALWSTWTWRLVPWFAILAFIVVTTSVVVEPARAGDLFGAFADGFEDYVSTSLVAGG